MIGRLSGASFLFRFCGGLFLGRPLFVALHFWRLPRATAVSGTNGMHLSFNVTWLYPSGADSRAYGFQLRCLSE